MLELIIIAFVFWVGYNVGQMVLSWQLRHVIRREALEHGIKVNHDLNIIKEEKPKVTKLWAEKIQDMLYLYEEDKKSFICQAKTMEELATLALKYKNIKYASVMTEEEIYAFVNGTAKSAEEILK